MDATGSFGSVRLARRVVPREGGPAKQYAVKALSKQRLRRMKKSVIAGADGRMVVRTGEDMVRACVRAGWHAVLGVDACVSGRYPAGAQLLPTTDYQPHLFPCPRSGTRST